MIDILARLGERLAGNDIHGLCELAVAANPWFTSSDICRAARAIASDMLSREALTEWLSHYPALPVDVPRNILIIMAGNIPFVGMQDLICVLAAGHRAIVKPSSKDTVLMSWVVEQLLDIAPDLPVSVVSASDHATDPSDHRAYWDNDGSEHIPDAVIAMGGSDTVVALRERYAEVPMLLRGHRSSLAVMDGTESQEEIAGLADDVLCYSGLGCRNVSLVFVPRGYDFTKLQSAISQREEILNLKHRNNYRQARALLEMNGIPYLDAGSSLLVGRNAGEDLFSSDVSVLNYAYYDTLLEVNDWISRHDAEIQCVGLCRAAVSHPRAVAFGRTQHPSLSDYPDGHDTMEFLASFPENLVHHRIPGSPEDPESPVYSRSPDKLEDAHQTPTLVVVVGPTGSGKTDLAIELATRLEAPILSTDSRQVYRGMRIGSAQPSEKQLAAVPHHFIADRDPSERFTCADFEREALELLDDLFAHKPFVVAVGGSGLYIDALCNGLDTIPDTDPELRKTLTDRLSRDGLKPLLEQLERLDPDHFATIDKKNPARVLRALEVCLTTGRPFSSLRTGTKTRRPFRIVKIGVDIPREELYARIDRRIDGMMAEGLEAEARKLHPLKHLPALRTVGYRELFDHFDGNYTDLDADGKSPDSENVATPLSPEKSLARAVEFIKRNSRRYAKRQLTWFRRDGTIRWFSPTDISGIMDHIENSHGLHTDCSDPNGDRTNSE